MMTIEQMISQYGLIACHTILLAAAAIALVRSRAETRRLRLLLDGPAVTALTAEPYDDRELRRMFDRRCTLLETRLEQLVERQAINAREASLTASPPRKNEPPVDYAVRMAKNGASLDDLVRGCGLNRGEAQLLMRLHAGRKPAAVAAH